jgi:hypothetical protein
MESELKAISETLSTALAKRIDLRDGAGAGPLVDQYLQLQVLGTYAEQLDGLDGAAAIAWMLRRMAQIEAGLLLLQAAKLDASLTAVPVPAPALPPSAPVPEVVTIPCDKNLVQVGFYPMERPREGVQFRWIGPAPYASVFVPKFAVLQQVTLRLHAAFIPQLAEEIRVAVDGGEWAAVTVERHGRSMTLTCTPQPGNITHASTMRLDIDAVQTESPASRGESDPRELSIAVSSIEITGFAKGQG